MIGISIFASPLNKVFIDFFQYWIAIIYRWFLDIFSCLFFRYFLDLRAGVLLIFWSLFDHLKMRILVSWRESRLIKTLLCYFNCITIGVDIIIKHNKLSFDRIFSWLYGHIFIYAFLQFFNLLSLHLALL